VLFGGVMVVMSAVSVGLFFFVVVTIINGLVILLSVILDLIVGGYGILFWAERV